MRMNRAVEHEYLISLGRSDTHVQHCVPIWDGALFLTMGGLADLLQGAVEAARGSFLAGVIDGPAPPVLSLRDQDGEAKARQLLEHEAQAFWWVLTFV